ncbi:MAG: DNA polymerase III subunit gamma/tau [Olsenella sp.]|jgi:DNA polymerase-3 subunit gamma/tau
MESLYRKYRPQTFDEVVGQAHVVTTLEHAVLEGRTSHAYLFCGPRGTGKTTMARLLAKALECEKGPGQLPDGTCEQCRLIAEGDHPDVYELDAASRTGVDNVREEIISRVGFAPVRGRFKVYIIDEVHMLTTAAFNALLKTLEEPPSHVVFVLCTTDPQKIPATILSRVQRFDFHPLGTDEMRAHLVHVCEQEGFTYDDDAIDAVVRHARGGMRDALSTLEQLSVFGAGTVSSEVAQDMLGSVSASSLEKVVRSMAGRDVAALFEEVGALVEQGRDLLQFVRDLSARVRDVYVASAVGASERVLPGGADEVAELEAEARAFGSTDRVARVLSVLGDVSNEMRTATNQRLALEVAFTRVARPEADLTLDSLAERVAELEATVARLASGVPAAVAAVPAAPAVPVAPARPAVPVPAPAPAAPATSRPAPPRPAPASVRPQPAPAAPTPSRPAPQAAPVPRAQAPAAPVAPAAPRPSRPAPAAAAPVPAAPAPSAPAAAGVVTDAGELQRLWKQTVDTLLRKIPSRGSLLMSSTILADDGVKLLVSLPKGSTFAMKMLERSDVSAAIAPYVAQVFGGPRQLAFAEPSLAATRIAHADRARAAKAPATAAPAPARPAPAPQAPGPAAAAPARRAPQAPATPARTAPAAPAAPEAPEVDLPWDPAPQAAPAARAPAPAPYEEPPYEQMPYDDLSAVSYDEAFQEDAPAPSAPPAAASTAPAPAAAPAPASRPAPAPAATPAQASAAPAGSPSFSAPEGAGAPEPPAPSAVPGSDAVPAAAYDDVPDELRGILENAFEVFGAGVKARTEPAQPAAKGYDSDAAPEGDDAGGEG